MSNSIVGKRDSKDLSQIFKLHMISTVPASLGPFRHSIPISTFILFFFSYGILSSITKLEFSIFMDMSISLLTVLTFNCAANNQSIRIREHTLLHGCIKKLDLTTMMQYQTCQSNPKVYRRDRKHGYLTGLISKEVANSSYR